MDFFKDIFENSSSDEDAQDEEKPKDLIENNSNDRIISESKNEEKNLRNDSVLKTSFDKKIPITGDRKGDHNTIINQNSSASKKVGFGVFANLDLDALNQRPAAKPLSSDVSRSKDNTVEKPMLSSNADETIKAQSKDDKYGPQLPPNYFSEYLFSVFLLF